MSFDYVAYLKKCSLAELMFYRKKALAFRFGYSICDSDSGYIPIFAIYAELNTREHYPNKSEARAIRQWRAKNKVQWRTKG